MPPRLRVSFIAAALTLATALVASAAPADRIIRGGRLLSIVHEAVPFVESCPDSRSIRTFHGGRAGAVRDQAAAIRLAFRPIGL
jgi:hypothetical protein